MLQITRPVFSNWSAIFQRRVVTALKGVNEISSRGPFTLQIRIITTALGSGWFGKNVDQSKTTECVCVCV